MCFCCLCLPLELLWFLYGASRIHAHCNCFGARSLEHIVLLRQWEHSKNSRSTRQYLILEHLLLHGPLFFIIVWVFIFWFFYLCLFPKCYLNISAEHHKYMHIAFVLVLFLLNILHISALLIQLMTYCKMLLFTKKGHNIILSKQNRSESEQQVHQGSYMKTEWCQIKPNRITWDWWMNQIKTTHSISTCN